MYGQYADLNPNGAVTNQRQFETYSCASRSLQDDEGRITAAIFDLGDRRLDVNNSASDDSARVRPGFQRSDINIRFGGHLLFWRALRNNPLNMTQYWGEIRSHMTTQDEVKAWNVLDYNWADIPRSPPVPNS